MLQAGPQRLGCGWIKRIQDRKCIPAQGWYSGSCLTVVTWRLSGSRQLHTAPDISKPQTLESYFAFYTSMDCKSINIASRTRKMEFRFFDSRILQISWGPDTFLLEHPQ